MIINIIYVANRKSQLNQSVAMVAKRCKESFCNTLQRKNVIKSKRGNRLSISGARKPADFCGCNVAPPKGGVATCNACACNVATPSPLGPRRYVTD